MTKFDDVARRHQRSGFIVEFWQFLRHNKKWWLLPMIMVIALLGVLTYLSGTGAAPFIYTLF